MLLSTWVGCDTGNPRERRRVECRRQQRRIDTISMNLSYLARSDDLDVLDSIVPLICGNMGMERVLAGHFDKMVAVRRDGRYGAVAIGTIVSSKKVVDLARHCDPERRRLCYDALELRPMLAVGAR